MRHVLMVGIAMLSMAMGATTSAKKPKPGITCPDRWVDPLYDCLQFEGRAQNAACARLAEKLNRMCDLVPHNLTDARLDTTTVHASKTREADTEYVFDPLAP